MQLRLSTALLIVATTSGCLGKFNTPSAYQEQRYLCDDAHAAEFQALADSCRVDGRCAGAFSMQGSMQGQKLTVETSLSDAGFGLVEPPGDPTETMDRLNLTGTSPYFQFIFHVKSLGGVVTPAGDSTVRTLQINPGASRLTNPLADDQVDVGQFLEVGGASADQQGQTSSGQVVITFLSSDEIKGTFHGNFGDSTDMVEGCFDALASVTTTNPAPTP
jgi:hypothetical protein